MTERPSDRATKQPSCRATERLSERSSDRVTRRDRGEGAAVVDREKALEMALAQIEKHFGKGAIMRLGADQQVKVASIPTGALSLDVALGIGGLPRGRVVEIYGPESSGKTTVALHAIAEAQRLGGIAAFVDAEHALDPIYAKNLGVDVDAEVLGVDGVQCVLGVDERRDAAEPLGLCDGVQGDRGLAAALRTVDLHHTPARQATDAEGHVQAQRPGRDGGDLHLLVGSQPHDGALAEMLLDLRQRHFEGLLAVHHGCSFTSVAPRHSVTRSLAQSLGNSVAWSLGRSVIGQRSTVNGHRSSIIGRLTVAPGCDRSMR